MKDRILQRVYVGFIASCLVIGFAAVAALKNINRATADADWVNHTHSTIYELDRVLSSSVAGDGAARTYIWNRHPPELAIARGEFSEMSDHLTVLQALTRDDRATAAQVAELAELAGQHATGVLALVGTTAKLDRAALEALLQSDATVGLLQQIKRRAATMRAAQFELLDQRDRAAYRQTQTTRWVVATCIILNLLLLGVVAWQIRGDIAMRRLLAATLEAANEQLETKVRERTQELVAANAKLSRENRERQWAAQALEHQLRYHQIIVDATSDLVFVVTRTLAVTRVNPAVPAALGWTEEEILGRPLADFVGEADLAAAIPALRAGREMHLPAVRLSDRQGHARPASFALLPLRDNDKVVGGVVLVRYLPPG